MGISKTEFILEKKRLADTIKEIDSQLSISGKDLFENDKRLKDYQKSMWENKHDLDEAEMKAFFSDNDYELFFMHGKAEKFRHLLHVKNKPYFGCIVFNNEPIYIGLTNVQNNYNYLVYDWRSPIASMFYDYGCGNAKYLAPSGTIEGIISRKRQYNIEKGELIHVFDNDVNVEDEVLQKVLSENSSDKMKNIVNTIQEEQNLVIRDYKTKYIVVQGIAGSGKTSVALHRVAFLLYRIENLNCNNVLIFSPNNVFTEYISNVLPELGENNTLDITFKRLANHYISEYKHIADYTNLIENYYHNISEFNELIKYKLSDDIIPTIELFITMFVKNTKFINDIEYKQITITAKEQNELLLYFDKFPLYERINLIAEKINNHYFSGKSKDLISIRALLNHNINNPKNYKEILKTFYLSSFFKNGLTIDISDSELIKNINSKYVSYEDTIILLYIKSLLEGLKTDYDVKQIIIDEAQDYTYLQYKLIKSIYRKASFTILGDVNQTINPYYKYDSLEVLNNIFEHNFKYCELLKTYRSSPEIIEYTNNILNLNFVSAIRNTNNELVKIYDQLNYQDLVMEINDLVKKYHSVAIITKGHTDCDKIFEKIKEKVGNLSKLDIDNGIFNKELVIMPSYAAKGLEFDATIIIDNFHNEKYLYYVACTRAQHKMIVFNM